MMLCILCTLCTLFCNQLFHLVGHSDHLCHFIFSYLLSTSFPPLHPHVLNQHLGYFYFPTAVNTFKGKSISFSVLFFLESSLGSEKVMSNVVNSFKNLDIHYQIVLYKDCFSINHPCAFYFLYMLLFPSRYEILNSYICHPIIVLFYL